MAADFYPYLAPYLDARDRRDISRARHRQTLFDVLSSVPNLIGAMGTVRRSQDQDANDQLFAQRLQEAISNPTGALPAGIAGPTQTPEVAAAREAAGTAPEGFFSKLLRTVSLGTAGTYQPRLGPREVVSIAQTAQGERRTADDRAYREAMLRLKGRENDVNLWQALATAKNQSVGRQMERRKVGLEERKYQEGGPQRAAELAATQALAGARDRSGAGGGGNPDSSARLWMTKLEDLSNREQVIGDTLRRENLDLGYSMKELLQAQLNGVKLPDQKVTPEMISARRAELMKELEAVRGAKADAAAAYRQHYQASTGAQSSLGGAPGGGKSDDELIQGVLDDILSGN